MESVQTQPTSPTLATAGGAPLKSSSSSTRIVDDVTSLTSFNPFSEEDEHESSYTLVSSLFSRVRNSFAAPLALSSTVAPASNTSASSVRESAPATDLKRPPVGANPPQATSPVIKPVADKLRPKIASASGPSLAPPLVSVAEARPETPTFSSENEKPAGRTGLFFSPATEAQEGGLFGTAIPGFPIQDDARSVHTTTSMRRSASISKVIRRVRGEGLSRDYWMDDENAKECYDCKSVFTTWRRKHHCRICGQIFCSRCASNIIKGSRFGYEGMLRVCNLCLEKLDGDDDGDDDDRRSVISNLSSSIPYPSTDHYLYSLGHHSQSPFAASQLFGRTDEPYNLYSIAETRRNLSGSDDGAFGSRPLTPGGDVENGYWEALEDAQPAPFRRSLTDEDKDPLPDPEAFPSDQSPTSARASTRTPEFPSSSPLPTNVTKSSIKFPGSSPEVDSDSLRQISTSRSRVNSFAETEVQTPFLRSRVHSRLNELIATEAGWRTRRESTAYAQELNAISMFHLRIMLRQMLTNEGISNTKEWEETLLRLALRIAKELAFTAYPYREGADMDVRRYVKIKKIPGGSPRDSEYVDGAVITKNVAHKQMSRSQSNPRIMLVTFPLEFQRVEGQYMHFGQIVRQEKEYLNNLVSRIVALQPHVVLAEKSVSRIALEALVKAKIAVARTVKSSAIKLVARMTQADILSSIDKLALEPHLGHCGKYRIQTFDHPLIPCRRKSYMRFEGCSRDLGCTIILRGEDVDRLKRVKKVTTFLAFIVRNLKLETHLWKDSVITAPHLTTDAVPQAYLSSISTTSASFHVDSTRYLEPSVVQGPGVRNSSPDLPSYDELPSDDAKSTELSRRIQESLELYLKTFISASATLRFPPPYPIRRMKELDDELHRARRAWEDEIIRSEEKPTTPKHPRDVTITASSSGTISTTDDIKAQIEALPSPELAESPDSGQSSSNAIDRSPSAASTDYFTPRASSSYSSPRPATPSSSPADDLLVKCEEVALTNEECVAAQSAYDLVKRQHDEQRRVWEWYLRKNKDDFAVDKYQFIIVMEFTLPITDLGSHRACFPPEVKQMSFYGKDDCTLGQFIEKAIHENLAQFLDPKAICVGKGCDQPLARHCKVSVHNESRLIVYVEHWDGQIKTRFAVPSPDLITTWSACRVCGSATPFIPVSEEMQRYSFAKFLELHFYPADVQLVQGAGCIHNIYQHHIRYFAMRGMTVTFQTDPITLHEIVYPPSRVHIRMETLVHLKNEDYESLLRTNAQWYSALVDDLKLINQDAATGDEEADAALTANIGKLTERAIAERVEIAKLIQGVYKSTPATDTLALNRVRAERQDKIVAWEAEFENLPKPKPSQLTEKDRKGSGFGTVRSMWPRRYDLPGVLENLQLQSSNVSESLSESEEAASRPESGLPSSTESVSDASDADASAEPTEAPESFGEPSADDEAEIHKTTTEAGSDSDSTIAAVPRRREDYNSHAVLDSGASKQVGEPDIENVCPVSKLPRRSGRRTTVADLVRRCQDREAGSSTFPVSIQSGMESDQETPILRRPRPRVKSKPKALSRKESVSDFEHSYAANIAPKYLAPRRTIGISQQGTRIPGPMSPADSRASSRRTSPDKRPSFQKRDSESTLRGRLSPPLKVHYTGGPGRGVKSGTQNRRPAKDRSQPGRIGSFSNIRNAIRKTSNANFGGRVSYIARQFEKMNRDVERTTRRYAVIRGRPARPVASSRATVEVFDSVRDAIKDVSDVSSDSSSEADDEGDEDDEMSLSVKKPDRTETDAEMPSEHSERDNEVHAHDDDKADGPLPKKDISNTDASSTPFITPLSEVKPLTEAMASPLLLGRASQTHCNTPSLSDIEAGPSTLERPSTIMKALSGFWPNHLRSHFDFESDDPMVDPEHIFRESSMVVRTDEPTSIIALALNSPQYRDMLTRSRAEKRLVKEPRISDNEEAFMPDECSSVDANSTWGVVNVDSGDDANPTEDLRVPSSKLPWAISFESGDLTITCTILYPEQFDALRRTCDCEKSMIESLARCVKWNASGGKSGSAFLKTRDDRFIAKELSRPELETMATFGPAYFDYMSSVATADRPSLLAKVFGCYKLVFRKKSTNDKSSRSKSTQMNLLVMENLFYDKRFSKIYDLKGSTRNRHVHATGRENEVLLDENLMQAHTSPFYVREHAKRLFRGALYNDTKFLADINVMDYSLLVGVDGVRNELVVGIVDYVRTYTWDKKLESWVKESTFLAGGGKGEPTIVTPKQYRQRFLNAMERYFPLVPDRWMKHVDNPEDEYHALTELWPDW